MIEYALSGIVLGGIYSLAAVALVGTYVSAGIVNFAFGAMAFFIARLYYDLHVEHGWPIVPAAVLCIVIVAPAIGIALWAVLFRHLAHSPQIIKIVATIGLAIAIPNVTELIFGNAQIFSAPGLSPSPVHVYRIAGVPINQDQVNVLVCVVAIVLVGGLVVRYTRGGLAVRAAADSVEMTELVGARPQLIAASAWGVSACLAGLSGVLMAPIVGLSSSNYVLLTAAAFAAMVVARLQGLGRAMVAGLLLGVVGAVLQEYLPQGSQFAQNLITAVPFGFVFVFLIFAIRGGRTETAGGSPGFFSRAAPAGQDERVDTAGVLSYLRRHGGTIAVFAVVAVLTGILSDYWVGLIAQGLAFGIVFLSYTLLAGEVGMISLCQISFAGIGGVVAAQLASMHGWPILPAILIGGLAAVPVGAIIGFLTLRMGNLYVALVTLTFGLLMDNMVFSLSAIDQQGAGVALGRPGFASGDQAFAYLALVIFCVFALFVSRMRRSTIGMAFAGVRWSETASRTLGVNVVTIKIFAFALSAFIAAIGGGMLASYYGAALSANYSTLTGLVYLAVVVTAGITSPTAAMLGGIVYSIVPALFTSYLPTAWSPAPAALFGLGGILAAKQPDGWVPTNARAIRALARTVAARVGLGAAPRPIAAPPGSAVVMEADTVMDVGVSEGTGQ